MMEFSSGIIRLTIGIFLISCSKEVTGVYDWKGNDVGPDVFRLHIKENQTFDYYGWSDVLGGDTIRGTWRLKGDTLHLKKNDLVIKDFIWLNEKRVDSKVKEVLVFDASDQTFLIGANVYINDTTTRWIVGPQGTIKLDSEGSIRKIIVNYLTYTDSVLTSDINANRFEVFINLKNRNQGKFFVNEAWLVKSGRLLPVIEGQTTADGLYRKKKNAK